MAQQKKKKSPGGQTGRPAFSEPRMQVFTKFNGCNFQLATRDFDNIFDSDNEAQTDLMPMFMAIQNNAGIVPMGGIETRQNMVKLFEPPLDDNEEPKRLNGVVTLVEDKLVAAMTDNSVYHGSLPTNGAPAQLDTEITVTDLNNKRGAVVRYVYSGVVE